MTRRAVQILGAGAFLFLGAALGVLQRGSSPPEPAPPGIELSAPPKASVAAGSPAGAAGAPAGAAPAAGANSLGMIRSGTYEEPPGEDAPAPTPEAPPAVPAPAAPPEPAPPVPDSTEPQAPAQPKAFQTKKLTSVRSRMDYGVSQERTSAQISAEKLPDRPADQAPAGTPVPGPAGPAPKPVRKFRAATPRAPLSTPMAVTGESADPTGVGPAADGSCPAAKPWKSPKNGNCYQTNLVCAATGGMTCTLRGGKGP